MREIKFVDNWRYSEISVKNLLSNDWKGPSKSERGTNFHSNVLKKTDVDRVS